MEIAGRQAVLGQVMAQFAAEAGRPAEPNVAVLPVGDQLANPCWRKPALFGCRQDVQAYAGCFRQRSQARDEAWSGAPVQ